MRFVACQLSRLSSLSKNWAGTLRRPICHRVHGIAAWSQSADFSTPVRITVAGSGTDSAPPGTSRPTGDFLPCDVSPETLAILTTGRPVDRAGDGRFGLGPKRGSRWRNGTAAGRTQPRSAMAQQIFNQSDRNHNDVLSRTEFSTAQLLTETRWPIWAASGLIGRGHTLSSANARAIARRPAGPRRHACQAGMLGQGTGCSTCRSPTPTMSRSRNSTTTFAMPSRGATPPGDKSMPATGARNGPRLSALRSRLWPQRLWPYRLQPLRARRLAAGVRCRRTTATATLTQRQPIVRRQRPPRPRRGHNVGPWAADWLPGRQRLSPDRRFRAALIGNGLAASAFGHYQNSNSLGTVSSPRRPAQESRPASGTTPGRDGRGDRGKRGPVPSRERATARPPASRQPQPRQRPRTVQGHLDLDGTQAKTSTHAASHKTPSTTHTKTKTGGSAPQILGPSRPGTPHRHGPITRSRMRRAAESQRRGRTSRWRWRRATGAADTRRRWARWRGSRRR